MQSRASPLHPATGAEQMTMASATLHANDGAMNNADGSGARSCSVSTSASVLNGADVADFVHEILAMNTLAMQRSKVGSLDEAVAVLSEAYARLVEEGEALLALRGGSAEGNDSNSVSDGDRDGDGGGDEDTLNGDLRQLLDELTATTLNNMGVLECHRGQPRQALSHFEAARQLEERRGIASPALALNSCAAYNALNLYDKATAAALETIDMLRTLELQRRYRAQQLQQPTLGGNASATVVDCPTAGAGQQHCGAYGSRSHRGSNCIALRSSSSDAAGGDAKVRTASRHGDPAVVRTENETAMLAAAAQPLIADSANDALWGAAWHNLAVAQINTAGQARDANEYSNALVLFRNAMRATHELLGLHHPMSRAVVQSYRAVRRVLHRRGVFHTHRAWLTAPLPPIDPREAVALREATVPAPGQTRHATWLRMQRQLIVTFRGEATGGQKWIERLEPAPYPGAVAEVHMQLPQRMQWMLEQDQQRPSRQPHQHDDDDNNDHYLDEPSTVTTTTQPRRYRYPRADGASPSQLAERRRHGAHTAILARAQAVYERAPVSASSATATTATMATESAKTAPLQTATQQHRRRQHRHPRRQPPPPPPPPTAATTTGHVEVGEASGRARRTRSQRKPATSQHATRAVAEHTTQAHSQNMYARTYDPAAAALIAAPLAPHPPPTAAPRQVAQTSQRQQPQHGLLPHLVRRAASPSRQRRQQQQPQPQPQPSPLNNVDGHRRTAAAATQHSGDDLYDSSTRPMVQPKLLLLASPPSSLPTTVGAARTAYMPIPLSDNPVANTVVDASSNSSGSAGTMYTHEMDANAASAAAATAVNVAVMTEDEYAGATTPSEPHRLLLHATWAVADDARKNTWHTRQQESHALDVLAKPPYALSTLLDVDDTGRLAQGAEAVVTPVLLPPDSDESDKDVSVDNGGAPQASVESRNSRRGSGSSDTRVREAATNAWTANYTAGRGGCCSGLASPQRCNDDDDGDNVLMHTVVPSHTV